MKKIVAIYRCFITLFSFTLLYNFARFLFTFSCFHFILTFQHMKGEEKKRQIAVRKQERMSLLDSDEEDEEEEEEEEDEEEEDEVSYHQKIHLT